MNFNISNMKTTIAIAIFGLSASFVNAQTNENLVPNGSFESIGKDPKKLGSIESANGWYSPTGVRADLFFPNKKVQDIGVPANIYGNENAKDGSNYAGIVAYSHNNKMPRSYVSTKLQAPLKKGKKYCVQFHVSLAEASTYSANQIGAYFSGKALASAAKESIIEKASVLSDENPVFNAPFGWDRVCNTYIADGGEKFITIGNFSANDATKSVKVKKDNKNKTPLIPAAYYYVDNISVVLIDDENPCDCSSADPTANYSKTVYQKAVNLNDKLSADKQIESLQVYFGFGKTDFTKGGEEVLDIIVKIMKENPGFKLQVNGFSDAEEDALAEDQNFFKNMDGKRVNAVFEYLKAKGIGEHRLIAQPQGSSEKSSEIVDGDEDDMIQAKNRRVEFKVRQ
jgi:OmpA-OmpF porin, OOP family